MAETKTSWTIDFLDRVTAPIKKMMKSVKESSQSFTDMGTSALQSEKEIKKGITNAKDYISDLKTKIKENEAELRKLEKAYEEAAPGRRQQEAGRVFTEQKTRVERLREALKGGEEDLKDFNKQLENLKTNKQNWAEVAVQVNQVSDIISKVSRSLDFSVEYRQMKDDVRRMTDLSGKALTEYIKKSREIGDVYNVNATEVARTANVLTKQMGGNFKDNLQLLEEGIKRGANVNGDYLKILERYTPVLRDMGISAEDATAMIANAAKNGINPDDFVNGIQKAGIAVTKMGVREQKALEKIGVSMEDLSGKSSFEAIQYITKAMDGMEKQAKQTVISTLFKEAGEKSGMEFVMGLSEGIPDLEDIPAVEQAGEGFKRFFSNARSWIADATGGIAEFTQKLTPAIQMTAGLTTTITALAKTQRGAIVIQKVLNFVMSANPIGIVIVALGALIGLIALAWNKLEGFRKIVFQGWEVLKNFGSVIKEFVIDRIKEMLSGISGIGKALMQFFKGDWKEAWQTGKNAMEDLSGVKSGAKAAENFKKGYQDGMRSGDLSWQDYEEKRRQKKQGLGDVNSFLRKDAENLDYSDPEGKNGKGKKDKDGLNVGSGAGGVKNIAMTLNVTNNFSVSKDTNVRDIADKIVGMVNDRLRDSLVTV